MSNTNVRPILFAALLAAGGCGGQYTLTVGDHVGAAGGEAPVVARLQRNDFFVLNLASPDVLLRFHLDDEGPRAAYTDKRGYAGTTLVVPAQAGCRPLRVDLLDVEGREVTVEGRLYALDADRPVVAVALDDLPPRDSPEAKVAAEALRTLAGQAAIVYLTREPVRRQPRLHSRLARRDLPDGAILPWQRQRWHVDRTGRIPKVVIETRLVSQLPELREALANLAVGICSSPQAAQAFAAAGMAPIVIGEASEATDGETRLSWDDIAAGRLHVESSS
jgi:hypothetical protein